MVAFFLIFCRFYWYRPQKHWTKGLFSSQATCARYETYNKWKCDCELRKVNESETKQTVINYTGLFMIVSYLLIFFLKWNIIPVGFGILYSWNGTIAIQFSYFQSLFETLVNLFSKLSYEWRWWLFLYSINISWQFYFWTSLRMSISMPLGVIVCLDFISFWFTRKTIWFCFLKNRNYRKSLIYWHSTATELELQN